MSSIKYEESTFMEIMLEICEDLSQGRDPDPHTALIMYDMTMDYWTERKPSSEGSN